MGPQLASTTIWIARPDFICRQVGLNSWIWKFFSIGSYKIGYWELLPRVLLNTSLFTQNLLPIFFPSKAGNKRNLPLPTKWYLKKGIYSREFCAYCLKSTCLHRLLLSQIGGKGLLISISTQSVELPVKNMLKTPCRLQNRWKRGNVLLCNLIILYIYSKSLFSRYFE